MGSQRETRLSDQTATIAFLSGFPGDAVVKNPPANAGDAKDAGLIPGSERSPGGGHATHASVLVWRILCTEELQFMRPQRVGHD